MQFVGNKKWRNQLGELYAIFRNKKNQLFWLYHDGLVIKVEEVNEVMRYISNTL